MYLRDSVSFMILDHKPCMYGYPTTDWRIMRLVLNCSVAMVSRWLICTRVVY